MPAGSATWSANRATRRPRSCRPTMLTSRRLPSSWRSGIAAASSSTSGCNVPRYAGSSAAIRDRSRIVSGRAALISSRLSMRIVSTSPMRATNRPMTDFAESSMPMYSSAIASAAVTSSRCRFNTSVSALAASNTRRSPSGLSPSAPDNVVRLRRNALASRSATGACASWKTRMRL